MLKPLEGGEAPLAVDADTWEGRDDLGSDDEFDDEMVNTQRGDRAGKTFDEAMDDNVGTIIRFAGGLRYQVQFRDERMLHALEREGLRSFGWQEHVWTKSGRRPQPHWANKATAAASRSRGIYVHASDRFGWFRRINFLCYTLKCFTQLYSLPDTKSRQM